MLFIQKAPCLLVIWWTVLILLVYAQIDPELCPSGATTILDSKWPNISTNFELFAELTSNSGTAEITQTLSNRQDRIIQIANGETLFEYWYFDSNERLTVLNSDIDQSLVPTCIHEFINLLTITSTIQSAIFIKPSILLGYDARDESNPSFGATFLRTSQWRLMPVNIFESCFYLNDSRQTVAATYYMTDVEKMPSFGYINQSIPLRIEVRMKSSPGGAIGTYFYNIFRFVQNLTVQQQKQTLALPKNVYCANQTNTRPIPSKLPEQISTNGETIARSDKENSIENFDVIYDQSIQLARFKRSLSNGDQRVEVHDFATGLVYYYSSLTRQCEVRMISNSSIDVQTVPGQTQYFQMAKPLHLFLLDDMSYQYTGSRECHQNVLCHVWIGQNLLVNKTGFERREWYWAYQINNETIRPSIPIRLVSTQLNENQKVLSQSEINLYDYRTNPLTVIEVDNIVAECYRALGPDEMFYYGIFSFAINNQDDKPVQFYSNSLKLIIWERLVSVLNIRPIRLSNVFIDHIGTELIVTFTLLDNPPFYGPVANPLKEPSLNQVIANLRKLIDSFGISFRAIYNETLGVDLYPKQGSLNAVVITPTVVLTNNLTMIIYQTLKNTTHLTKLVTIELKSGTRITAFWIGFLALGLAIGAIVVLAVRYFRGRNLS